MSARTRRRAASWTALGAVTAVLISGCSSNDEPKPDGDARPSTTAGSGDPLAVPTGPLATGPAAPASGAASQGCPQATVQVSTAEQLDQALAKATPGTSIQLADGTYEGTFTATAKGTAQTPITLCGTASAVLDGGGVKKGYALHLDGADYWHVTGFTVRNAQKGVMGDGTNHSVISGLTVTNIGDEAIHLRKFSSDNVVEKNTIANTGLRRAKYGEGVYIGSAVSNWTEITAGAPDNSDRNVVRDNRISATTAESVDVKEGTTGGTVTGNTFDGSALAEDADSWVDVKGNSWTISDNTGTNSPVDGFQTHVVAKGWGRGNTFTGNLAQVNGSGFGFHFAPVEDNRLSCDNKVVGAAEGLANVDCA
ncbi:hypothetical protein Acy02nite_18410 [Actinoplanes cyaneus]|uniref:Right handed beta helix domain-containing protein n=1 Tax=Actinoplanes cyaneus TaxID=52696 RepID=A0A919IDA5_9ACTN|nr:right-handed parallel beta-helix repeat-containing protein [Actinoplanes cyaneus]MCW2136890.1 Nitrous oxidase accessory protein NosD, contains tandem CASH domains [Actinoplanes cyaneus]GID63960.1 hypothetical protein Acy02nite_18410 [Actinoplanes cyaneus]